MFFVTGPHQRTIGTLDDVLSAIALAKRAGIGSRVYRTADRVEIASVVKWVDVWKLSQAAA